MKTIKTTSGMYLYSKEDEYQKLKAKKIKKGNKNVNRILSMPEVPDYYLGEAGICYNREDNGSSGVCISNYHLTVTGAVIITKYNIEEVIFSYVSNLLTCKWEHFTESIQEYMWPDTNHPDFKQWVYDCIPYCLFHKKNYCGSFINEQITIINQWFWILREKILEILDQNYMTDLYNQVNSEQGERTISSLLQSKLDNGESLSTEAQDVLDYATELTIDSFVHRIEINRVYPEFMLNTWDAGWFQIRLLLSEISDERLDIFDSKYEALETFLKPGIIKFGFLK